MAESLAFTPEQLQALINGAVTAAVTAANAPKPLTEQEQRQQKQDAQDRFEVAQSKQQEDGRTWESQEICSHEHAMAIGGMQSHAVWVQESYPVGSPGYMLCQVCQGRFRPENVDHKYDPNAHYSTATFNRLFQASRAADIG